MASQASVEILERAVTAHGRILRVEADRADALPHILALTFDVGRVLLRPVGEQIGVEAVPDRDALPAGLVPLDEEDPWWRVLGQPITAVWPIESGGGGAAAPSAKAAGALKLRFRERDQNPRVVGIAVAGPALRVTLEGH